MWATWVMRRVCLHFDKFPRTFVAARVRLEGLQGRDSTSQIKFLWCSVIFVEARLSLNRSSES